MSPRAAWRLESLGFSEVYDYRPGKLDWLAAGLPTQGSNAGRPRTGDIARKDVPTCSLHEGLGDVRERVRSAGSQACVVVNEERVVMGLLRSEELEADPDRLIEEVMRRGPTTFRPHISALEMAEHMVEHDIESSPITTSDGRLVGVLFREDVLELARKDHERHEHD
jgi:Mg/Co/Ni transporter MgtE